MDDVGYVIVGGHCPTVSPAGFSMGGGNSPLARMYGYGLDNVIHMTMVTAGGEVIQVHPNGKNVDTLF